jgi:hypothetical protein
MSAVVFEVGSIREGRREEKTDAKTLIETVYRAVLRLFVAGKNLVSCL